MGKSKVCPTVGDRMITIHVFNAKSKIECTEEPESDISSHILSYFVEGSKFAGNPYWDGRIRLIKKGWFPTGLLDRLTKGLTKQGLEFVLDDHRVQPPLNCQKLSLEAPIELRPYQTSVVELTKTRPRGIVVLGTGGGKSITLGGIIAEKEVTTLVVTPDTGLRDQLSETLTFMFGVSKVGNHVGEDKPIIVSNIQALVNKPKEAFERFKMLLVDEFHHSGASSYRTVNDYCENAFWRYGFTGTPTRSSGDLMELVGVLSKIIFKKTTSELIQEGWLVKPRIVFHTYDLAAKRLNYKSAYSHLTLESGINKLIASIANFKIAQNKQTLVLVRHKAHGRLLRDLIPEAIYLSGDDDEKYREDMKKAFIRKDIPCLIATSIFGEGTDIPTIDVLINGRFEKTEIQTKQGVGRALRLAPGKTEAEVFDFIVQGNKHTMNHSAERLKTYKSEPEFLISIKKFNPEDYSINK
jgi:superfamily II DNA or RNA helicase